MTSNPWAALHSIVASGDQQSWLASMLARNHATAYLRQFGAPQTLAAFRAHVPTSTYDDLLPWLERIQAGDADLLFNGRPIAYERTSGSSGPARLLPYTLEGLRDFQQDIVPWLAQTVRQHRITGRVYCAISPATRQPESVGDIPVGLSDAAYLGERAGGVLAATSAVPLSAGSLANVDLWRQQTLRHLKAASDLQLISVWSPTFLLRLLDDIADPQAYWPQLKIVSCWASASAQPFAQALQQRLPHAVLQPKGLLSTEAVITLPNASGVMTPAHHVFVEYEKDGQLLLENELVAGTEYAVIVTTGSGLYRYRTGDNVVCLGHHAQGAAMLDFVGRGNLVSDLVGEKLSEAFVTHCFEQVCAFCPSLQQALLIPDAAQPGYVLVCPQTPIAEELATFEQALCANPQYAYARALGQLAPLRALVHSDYRSRLEQSLLKRGARLGDIKPLALRREAFWLSIFEATP